MLAENVRAERRGWMLVQALEMTQKNRCLVNPLGVSSCRNKHRKASNECEGLRYFHCILTMRKMWAVAVGVREM